MTSLLRRDDASWPSISPKQHPLRAQRDWYPYYAGFTEQFVENVLSADWHDFRNVLDPWSGSGTTTAVCTKTGLASKGLDINPALTVIARGRLVPANTKRQLQELTKQVVSAAHRATPTLQSSDLLRLWLADDAVFNIRCIEDAVSHGMRNGFRRRMPRAGNLYCRQFFSRYIVPVHRALCVCAECPRRISEHESNVDQDIRKFNGTSEPLATLTPSVVSDISLAIGKSLVDARLRSCK